MEHVIHKPRGLGYTCAIGYDCDGHCKCPCKYFRCIQCNKPCTQPLVTKCDPCFERGRKRQPPRQSGRTVAKLRQVEANPGAIFVVPLMHMVRALEFRYPWLKGRIKTPSDLRGQRSNTLFIDHTVWEFPIQTADLEELRYQLQSQEAP